MNSLPMAARERSATPRSNSGAVLLIALIALVAMTLAGIAIMRSVDATNLIAGNLSFKQASIHASDKGIEQAYQWLLNNRPALVITNPGNGYFSARPGSEPSWDDPDTWANAINIGTDAAGNTVSYLIHRMCTEPDTPYNGSNAGVANQCALDIPVNIAPPPTEGGSFAVGASAFYQDPMVYYRITVRIAGPHNTTSFVQAMVAIGL